MKHLKKCFGTKLICGLGLVVAVVAALSLLIDNGVVSAAGGWIGSGSTSGSAGGGGGGGGGNCSGVANKYTLDCAGVSWIFYQAQGKTNNATSIDHFGYSISASVPGECSQHDGGGFWHFGANVFGIGLGGNGSFGYPNKPYGHWKTLNWGYSPWAGVVLSRDKLRNGSNASLNQWFGPYKAVKYGSTSEVFAAYKQAYAATTGEEYTGGGLPSDVFSFCWWQDMDADWEADGTSKVSKDKSNWKTGDNAIINVRPSQTVYWNHTVKETSNKKKATNVNVAVEHQSDLISGSRNWAYNTGLGDYKNGVSTVSGNKGSIFYNKTLSYTTTQDDVDKRLCERVTWSPKTGKDKDKGTQGIASKACITVPYHYPSCDPSKEKCDGDNNNPPDDCVFRGDCPGGETKDNTGVDGSTSTDKSTTTPGDKVTFTYDIDTSGPTKSKPLHYKVYTFILQGGKKLPDNADHQAAYPKSWGSDGVGCGGRDVPWSDIRDGKCDVTKEGFFENGIYPNDGEQFKLPFDIDGSWLGNPGDQICSYIATDKWNVYNGQEANTYAASNIACTKIGKNPQIQIIGSDSYAGKGFQGTQFSTTKITGSENRGSYSQYSLLTGKAITGFGSGGYTYVSDINKNLACRLAFANTVTATGACNNSSALGNAGLQHTLSIPEAGSLPGVINSVNLGSMNGTYRYSGSSPMVVNGGSLRAGQHITIYTTGDIKITGNITYDQSSFTNARDIPTLTLVSDNGSISVNGGVSQVAANLVAPNGKFVSCAESPSGKTNTQLGTHPAAACQGKLVINGSVVTGAAGLQLRRTFGSGNVNSINQWDGNTISSTSEWFNYTPNNWLTPYLGTSDKVNGYTTNSISTLPVRY